MFETLRDKYLVNKDSLGIDFKNYTEIVPNSDPKRIVYLAIPEFSEHSIPNGKNFDKD